jgi:hypothetical protein
MKTILFVVFGLILFSLFSALTYLIKDTGNRSDRTVKALTWRISLSLALFVLLIVAYLTGMITPNAGP